MRFNDTSDSDTASYANQETTNKAGGTAYEPVSAKLRLYQVTVNNMLEPETDYYAHDSLQTVQEAFDAVADADPEFALELAAYARNEMGNRDIAVLLFVLAANDDRFTPEDPAKAVGVRDYGPRILKRMDEPMTALAMHDELVGGTPPKALKKGIADAVDAMLEPDYDRGAYRLGKYQQTRREVTLFDAVNRSHVRAYAGITDGTYKDELMTRLMEGDLRDHDAAPLDPPGTWENIISEEGNTAEAWRKALTGDHDGVSHGMGIMARVRNIRNMLEAGLDGEEIFGDDEIERVKHSRMFPFRLYTAYKAYQDAPVRDTHVEEFLEDAIEALVENIPDTWTDTAVGIDLSGSMVGTPVSGRSVVDCADLSAFFGAIMVSKGAYAEAFGKNTAEVTAHTNTPVLELTEKIRELANTELDTGGTNAWMFMRNLSDMDRDFDRVVFLTDMQAWDNRRFVGHGGLGFRSDDRVDEDEQTVKEWIDEYRDDPEDVAVYTLDLASYGDLMTPERYPNVYRMSGWNEKLIEFVEYAENPAEILDDITISDA